MASATKQTPIRDANNNAVRVEIFDSKMRAVAEQTHTVDTVRLAVLAALNIADEFHLLRRKADTGSSDYAQRAQHLSTILDEVLEETRKAG